MTREHLSRRFIKFFETLPMITDFYDNKAISVVWLWNPSKCHDAIDWTGNYLSVSSVGIGALCVYPFYCWN
jgi:hypothetical protein